MSCVSFKEEIVVFCGPMFSGKSFSMIFQLEKLKYAKVPFVVFKPDMDRYKGAISSRFAGLVETAVPIDANSPKDMLKHVDLGKTKTVAIDEAQFFSKDIVEVVKELQKNKIQVLIAGLDLDGWGNSFGPMPDLLALATRVVKNVASCIYCGEEATRTLSTAAKVGGSNVIAGEGKENQFVPSCSSCFYKKVIY